MSRFILDKPWQPWKNKDWLVWPKTTFKDLYWRDCDNTVDGVCYTDKTLKDCIGISEEQGSDLGYHIQFNNGKTICVPLLGDTLNTNINPFYDMRNQNIYPEFDNINSSVYINTDKYNFPPEKAATVFYSDAVVLKNIKSGLYLQKPSINDTNRPLVFGDKDTAQIVHIIPNQVNVIKSASGKPVEYGHIVTFSIEGTSLLPVDENGQMKWVLSNSTHKGFQILPEDDIKNRNLWFNSRFRLKYNSLVYCSVEGGYILLSNIKDNNSGIFVLEPKTIGYYCDGDQCKPVSLEETEQHGGIARYKDMTVGRLPGCWGACNYLIKGGNDMQPFSNKPSSNSRTTEIILFCIIFILILSTIYFVFKPR